MHILINRTAVQDTRPTAAAWPKAVPGIEDLPSPYREYLEGFQFNNSIPEHMIYVEKASNGPMSQEYVLAVCEGQILLWFDQDGRLDEIRINPKDIVKIIRYEKLLYCELEIHIDQGFREEICRFSYNTSREELFYPAIVILFGKNFSVPLKDMEEKDEEFKAFKLPSIAMTNLKQHCYQFGDHAVNCIYYTRKEPSPLRKRKKIWGEYLIVKTNRGYCHIKKEEYFITTAYYFQSHLLNAGIVKENEKGYLFLNMTTGKDIIELQKVPDGFEEF